MFCVVAIPMVVVLASCGGIRQIRFCLCHTETEFRIFDDKKRVAFAHLLILVKVDFLDESRYTGIDRCDMLFHLRIIRIFDISQVDKPGTNISDTTDK